MEYDESRVYTSLNAGELKVGDKVILADNIAELIRLVKFDLNITELKGIRTISCNARFEGNTLNFLAYLVERKVERKKEKKYRPYESIDEFVSDFIKKFNTNCPKYGMPFIWVKSKETSMKHLVRSFYADVEEVGVASNIIKLNWLFNEYEYLDGSPCGKEIEE